MRPHLTNADDRVLHYTFCPIGLALVALIVLCRLCVSEFKSWMIATNIMSASGTVAYISLVGRSAILLVVLRLLYRLGLRGLPIARVLYGATLFLPFLPPLSWQCVETRGRRCVSCIAIPHEAQEGSQS